MTSTLDVELEERIPETGAQRAVEVNIEPGSGKGDATGGERHFVFCVDTSGSMSWEADPDTPEDTSKMEKLKSGFRTALEDQLKDEDYVGIVTFSSTAETVVPIQNWGEGEEEQFWNQVNDLGARGKTDIYGALKNAHEELRKERTSDAVRRILLLTDGKHNTSHNRDPDFEQLAADINDSGVSIMAAGVGSDYDRHLMKTLADASRGNWHHLETEEGFESFVEDELDRQVQRTNPELVVDLNPQFDAHEFNRRVRGQSQPGGETWKDGDTTAVIPLGDLVAGESQSVTFNLIAPPREPGFETTAADIKLRYGDQTVEELEAQIEYVGTIATSEDGPGVLTPAERRKLEDKYEEKIVDAKTEDERDEIEKELKEVVENEYPDLYDKLMEQLEAARNDEVGVLAKQGTLSKKDD